MSSEYDVRPTLEEWAGSQSLNLTLVFTDIVDSTVIGRKLGDRRWIEDLFAHFSLARSLASHYDWFRDALLDLQARLARCYKETSDGASRFAWDRCRSTGCEIWSASGEMTES